MIILNSWPDSVACRRPNISDAQRVGLSGSGRPLPTVRQRDLQVKVLVEPVPDFNEVTFGIRYGPAYKRRHFVRGYCCALCG